MAATLGELRAGLKSVLEDSLQGFNVYDYPPDDVTVPAVAVSGFQLDASTFADESIRVAVDVEVLVSRRHVDQVQALDELLSPSGDRSVWAIFNDRSTLDDRVAYCTVQSAGDYRELVIAEVGYYAATFRLSVML